MNAPLNTVLAVAPFDELQPFEVDALDAFAAWLIASGKMPCVFDSLVGVKTLGFYQAAKAKIG